MKYNKVVNAKQQTVCLEALWSDITIANALKDFGLNEKTADLGDCLDALFRTFGVPRTLHEVGFEGEEKILAAAKNTLLDPFAATNARPLLEASQAEEIIRAVL
jgi:alcohol dehydrogenase class IV